MTKAGEEGLGKVDRDNFGVLPFNGVLPFDGGQERSSIFQMNPSLSLGLGLRPCPLGGHQVQAKALGRRSEVPGAQALDLMNPSH